MAQGAGGFVFWGAASASAMDSQTRDYAALLTGLGGGLALFLYGMRKMTDSLKIAAGGSMKRLLERLSTNRFTATMAGALVTAVIRSSSATTVMVIGFVIATLLSFSQSIGVIMGTNIGTTITAQIIAFKVAYHKNPHSRQTSLSTGSAASQQVHLGMVFSIDSYYPIPNSGIDFERAHPYRVAA